MTRSSHPSRFSRKNWPQIREADIPLEYPWLIREHVAAPGRRLAHDPHGENGSGWDFVIGDKCCYCGKEVPQTILDVATLAGCRFDTPYPGYAMEEYK